MLSGKLLTQVWLRARSVFVHNKEDNPRPLGIYDSSWYRFVGHLALLKVGERIGNDVFLPVQLGSGVTGKN